MHDPDDNLDPDENAGEFDEDDETERGPLHGILIGPPFAIATDCGLVVRNDEKRIPGCCACLSCDQCGQLFRIDLLSDKGMHACPKCKLEYTSVLIVATADDHTMLQYALETVLRSQNPGGEPDDEQGGEDDDPSDLGDEGDPDQVDDEDVPVDETPR